MAIEFWGVREGVIRRCFKPPISRRNGEWVDEGLGNGFRVGGWGSCGCVDFFGGSDGRSDIGRCHLVLGCLLFFAEVGAFDPLGVLLLQGSGFFGHFLGEVGEFGGVVV